MPWNLDRRRTSVHEAGHLVAAALIGVEPGMASIRPFEHPDGSATNGWSEHGPTGTPRRVEIEELERPFILLPADVRLWVERRITILLAGETAVRLYAPHRETGFFEPPRELAKAA